MDKTTTALTKAVFNKCYRDLGEKCWLIKSYEKALGHKLAAYLKAIPKETYSTATCLLREPWYEFKPFPIADILVASGFTHFGPKVVKNTIGAHHVGSVYGVFAPKQDHSEIVRSLKVYNFEKRVIAHSGKLKKIEVSQLNGVLRRMHDEVDC